jgi:hypothetical protein
MAKRTTAKRRLDVSKTAGQYQDVHVDGCDLDFRLGKVTADHELPPAKGGVEAARVPRRKSKVAKRGRKARP